MSLVHLHCHDEYSFDAVGTCKHFAARAAAMGQPALAKTNHGTLSGVIHHINACREEGVLPIVGCEAYYRPNRRVQGQKDLRYVYFHVTLLAKNETGFRNLMRITSEANISGYYTKPCVDLELLRNNHEGLILGLGCLRGWLAKCIEQGDSTAAHAWVRDLKMVFGDDMFGEVMPSGIEDQVARNSAIVQVCDDESVMVCATVDAHSPEKDWVETQDVRLMVKTNQSLKKRDEKRAKEQEVFEFKDDTYYLQSEQEVLANFAAHHPAISTRAQEFVGNTLTVASRVLPFGIGRHTKMPKVERERSAEEILRQLCREGMAEKVEAFYRDKDPVGGWSVELRARYEERLDFELATFAERDIFDYFVMVWETVSWAKSEWGVDAELDVETLTWKAGPSGERKKPIMIGPGRGSAAGCLVSYLVGITGLDPIQHRLLFERFLNPARKGMPDIDVDFPTDRIDEVEAFTAKRFGKKNVIDVIAHSTFGPRAAIRRVGTALCLPFPDIDKAAKSIDDADRSALEDLRTVNPAVNHIAETYDTEEWHRAWTHMCRLQGQIMGKSEHAAALLVTPPGEPIIDVIPIERSGGQKGKLITGWGERAGKGNSILSDFGFTKFDWLRIKELDKQQYAVDLIYEQTGELVDLDSLPVHQDPYATDPEVMRYFAEGLLTGIFQFAQTAKKLTRRVKPDNIFDLAAINALIRPGPRGNHDDMRFIERKNGRQEVTYWHPKLEPFLDYTLGVMVFQEQLIEVVHHLGGLSKPEADNFRKIASKLYRDPVYARQVMGEWYEPIKAGFIANGITEEQFGRPAEGDNPSTGFWANFLSFSDYSFNLSHADGYAVLAYRGQWLKRYYPWAFYAAFLSKGLSQKTDLAAEQKEAAAREARGLGLKVLPPDINSSGIDYTAAPDGTIRLGLESVKNVGFASAKEILERRDEQQFISYQDFDQRVNKQRCNIVSKAALINAGAFDEWHMRDDYTEERIDELEREFIGVSLTSHYSILNYTEVIDPRIWPEEDFDEAQDGTRVIVAGEIIGIKEILDSKNQRMCFVELGYGANEWSCTFFASTFPTYEELIKSRRPIIVAGEKSTWKGRSSVIVEQAQDVDELAKMLREGEATEPAAA